MSKEKNRRDFLKAVTLTGVALGSAGVAEAGESRKAVVPRRELGKTGAKTSILGLGLGSRFTKPFADNPDAAHEILMTALAHGINYWDTARNYGESEVLIGPSVKENRERIFLVSKSQTRDYDGFMRDLETGLKNLQTDYIDLYHVHNMNPDNDPDLDFIENGAIKAARKAREEGIIRHFGLTGHSGADILMEGINRWDPDVVMSVYPADRPRNGEYEDRLLPLAREQNVGMVAMKAVRHAMNTDWPGTQLIRYAMSLPGIATTIVGLDSMAHLKENIEMASNFTAMTSEERVALSVKVKTDLAHFGDAPWENRKYDDDSANPLWA